MQEKIRLGELLVQNNIINQEQLNSAMQMQQTQGGKLGNLLVDLGYIDETTLLKFLADHLRVPYIDLKRYSLDPNVIRQLPENYARRFRAIILANEETGYFVGMVDPRDLFAYDELVKILKRPLRLAIVSENDLLQSIDLIYRRTQEISSFAEELSEEISSNDFDLAQLGTELAAADIPVVKLLQSIFEDAIQINASDIHIEPDETVLRIRQRIDGVLYENIMKDKRIASALTLRLKLMAGLNISEKRLPQDGRFTIKVKGKSYDVRLSTLPIQNGESVVMRLLNQSVAGAMDIGQIGMPSDMLHEMKKIINLPHGMILVTGPTGSGKTTTLYGVLNELNKPENKIITIEDPVEYHLPRINQVQVNAKVELTFARVLRAALRQDPDTIMVGEIRDEETASIALRAAITGHFVLATLHTNDAISTVTRLIDIGAESYLVGAALRAVIAQRLVRRICNSCIQDYVPTEQEIEWLKSYMPDINKIAGFKFGKGCSHCNGTGYKGRLGVFELLILKPALMDALRTNDSQKFTEAAKDALVYGTLATNGLEMAKKGQTTISEVIRITGMMVE